MEPSAVGNIMPGTTPSEAGSGEHPQAPSTFSTVQVDEVYDAESRGSQKKTSEASSQSRFVRVEGSIGGTGYNETTVDVITVPCPGADPLETWSRDPLVENYFGAPSMRSSTRTSDMRESQTSSQTAASARSGGRAGAASWVRMGIRKEASTARVLMYAHRELGEGTTLNQLADDLLQQILDVRLTQSASRPIFFICHSVGGLVVKMALSKASRNPLYETILYDCYGVAFFATPHRGSTYLSIPDIAPSIQGLLQLSQPLPKSITDELHVAHPLLLHLDEEFRVLASDLQVWTFYETIESRISGQTESRPGEVCLTTPITSLKSAILGIRQESIYPLQSDHANCASFGRSNAQTMKLFLKTLARAVAKADRNGRGKTHTPIDLDQKIPIEVHGFYEDPVAVTTMETLTSIRAWSTRVPLKEFLVKGPVECVNDRLNEVSDGPTDGQFMATRRRTTRLREENLPSPSELDLEENMLGITGVAHDARSTHSETALLSSPAEIAGSLLTPHRGETAPAATPSKSPDPGSLAIRPTVRESRSLSLAEVRSRSTSGRRTTTREDDDDLIEKSPKSRRRVALTRRFTDQFNGKWSGPLERTFFQGSHFSPDPQGACSDAIVPVFTKPDPKNRKFIWTHLPFTNPAWVKRIFETLEVKDGKDFSEVFNHGQWYSKHTRGRHSQHYAYFVRPACGWIPPIPRSPLPHQGSAVIFNEPVVYLFVPFLHFDSYKNLLRRRALIQRRLHQGRARPVPQNVARLESLELQVIWEYLGYDPPVNCRRTLDQYGYPSLHDTRPRDDDQMLYKMTKERISFSDQVGPDTYDNPKDGGASQHTAKRDASSLGSVNHEDDCECSDDDAAAAQDDVLNGNVLMVDQLWMWVIGPNTLLTFFSKRESDPAEGPLYQQADLRDSILNDVNADVTRQCENSLDMAALVALHAVTVLLDRTSHPDLEIFRIFEEAISILAEKMTSSLKDFRTQGLRDKTRDQDAADDADAHRNHGPNNESSRAEHENRDSTSALLELRDIEDELSTLFSLFDRQEKMLGTMRNVYRRVDATPAGVSFLTEALGRLSEYKQRAADMLRRVKGTREDYDKLLQMVQRQAQVDEVRLQRLQADVASSQSRSVLIFTVFTVIFLPLSFFTSLFGMNTREWADDERLPTLGTVFLITIPASACLVFLALASAWSTRVRRFFVFCAACYSAGAAAVSSLADANIIVARLRREGDERRRAREEAARRRRRKRTELRRRGKEASAESHDFWERHRLEREHAYRIPVANRKSITKERAMARAKADKKA